MPSWGEAIIGAYDPVRQALRVEGGDSGGTSTTANITSVAASTSAVTLLAANPLRWNAAVTNNATSGNLFLSLGASTPNTTTNFTVMLLPGGYYEIPGSFSGVVKGIWNGTPSGSATITEMV